MSQEAGQVVWYSHLFQNFPQFVVIHAVKGFGLANKAEVDVFLELLLLDLHTDFSGGRSGGLVFPSLSEFSTVCCDTHSQRLWHSH